MNNEPDANTEQLNGLLFETSPYGNIDAIVQHDGRAVYFYLNGVEPFGTRACWVRNLQAGPLVLNEDEMQQGLPPMLPKTHCRNAAAQPIPVAENLEIVWFEEGNGAALLEGSETIAVIPPWSGVDGFHGYAAECAVESPLCWPLPENESLQMRISRAAEFWNSCKSESEHPFAFLQPQLLACYENQFSAKPKYFAIDGGQFPPRGACVFRPADQQTVAVATVGMSLRPQPNIEMFVETPSSQRRIELAITLPGSPSDEQLQPLLEQISGLVSFPWQQWTWFGHGHTCAMRGLDGLLDRACEFVAFVNEKDSPISELVFRDDPIILLRMLPISADQQKALSSRELSLDDLAG